MSLKEGLEWVAEFNEVQARFSAKDQLVAYLANLQNNPVGRLSVMIDRGPVGGLEGLLLEQKRNIVSCFSVDWDGPYASLIFHDDDWSEYRAIDQDHPVWPTDDERRNLAHGEFTPPPFSECMDKTRAFTAMQDFLQIGECPKWLSYRYMP